MVCYKCTQVKNNNYNSFGKCSFHITKDIMCNYEYEKIKEWIDSLTLCQTYSHPNYYNPSFEKIMRRDLPNLLKQKTIHKKLNEKTLSKLVNYILSLARKKNLKISTYSKNCYLKYVSGIKMINFGHGIGENNLLVCIKQGCSLTESLKYCYPQKKGNDIMEIIKFYRKRDLMLTKHLYYLPNCIIEIIINILD